MRKLELEAIGRRAALAPDEILYVNVGDLVTDNNTCYWACLGRCEGEASDCVVFGEQYWSDLPDEELSRLELYAHARQDILGLLEHIKDLETKIMATAKEGVEILWMSRGGAEMANVLVDGCVVPYLEIYRKKGGPEDGQLSVSLTRLTGPFLSIDVASEQELYNWLPLVANAMAVAAGFSCHGVNSRPLNPFASQAHCITGVTSGDESA